MKGQLESNIGKIDIWLRASDAGTDDCEISATRLVRQPAIPWMTWQPLAASLQHLCLNDSN